MFHHTCLILENRLCLVFFWMLSFVQLIHSSWENSFLFQQQCLVSGPGLISPLCAAFYTPGHSSCSMLRPWMFASLSEITIRPAMRTSSSDVMYRLWYWHLSKKQIRRQNFSAGTWRKAILTTPAHMQLKGLLSRAEAYSVWPETQCTCSTVPSGQMHGRLIPFSKSLLLCFFFYLFSSFAFPHNTTTLRGDFDV